MRASDADRERLINELNEHTAEGRLSTDELEERLEAAYSARTKAELDRLREDLPETPRQVAQLHRERRAHLTRRMFQETGGSIGLFVICTAVWLVSGSGRTGFWPVWVLVIVGVSLARTAWALYGPAPDLDAAERHLNRRGRHHSHQAARRQYREERRDQRRVDQ
jgi:hypothetical protein